MTNFNVSPSKKNILKIYALLIKKYGRRNWWPAETPFEVIIGAILTQNVSWSNARKAVENLKLKNMLDFNILFAFSIEELAPLIRSSRFYNQKAKKIKNFLDFFYSEYDGDISKMKREEQRLLRKKMLEINGLGEETVDSILLYACEMPIFVVDAYTKRIFSRYGFIKENASYRDVQTLFMENLPKDIALYNDYHAQIVHLGNSICKKNPLCDICPIRENSKNLVCQHWNLSQSTSVK